MPRLWRSRRRSGRADAGGSGLGAYQYRTNLNQGPWTAPISGGSTTISGEGQTEVEFRSTDVAGNASAWSSPVEVWLDRTAPTFTISANPSHPHVGLEQVDDDSHRDA